MGKIYYPIVKISLPQDSAVVQVKAGTRLFLKRKKTTPGAN
jgi:hypothetical protein